MGGGDGATKKANISLYGLNRRKGTCRWGSGKGGGEIQRRWWPRRAFSADYNKILDVAQPGHQLDWHPRLGGDPSRENAEDELGVVRS